ncbi:MAG TPA: hypothetical protein ENI87_01525 [bacterium]|nr:hypothetical protein [bacterium]
MRFQLPFLLLLSVLFASCGRGVRRGSLFAQRPRLVSILVEVYDPNTNLVWDGISVRIVESYQEWSGCTCANPYTEWFLTNQDGRVLLDEYDLADAQVGFQQDYNGAAVLGPGYGEDEATVLLEVDAIGFAPVYVEVPLSWDDPDVFVEVPFY